MSGGEDVHDYIHFTGRQRRDTALHVLEGLFVGVQLDREINAKENRAIRDWLDENDRLAQKDIVFRELSRTLRAAIADGVLTSEEMADLQALCQRAKSTSQYYDPITHAIQELHGLLHGVVADLVVNTDELRGLRDWIEDHSEIRALWPITEIDSLITKVLSDQKLEQSEQKLLLHFFSEFVQSSELHRQLPPLEPSQLTVSGVCAVDPELLFSGRVFCFTGVSSRGPRKVFAEAVESNGGVFVDSIRQDLNYLIIGDEGNPCWAFSCYGRKVERVVEMRRNGASVLLVHERDFWDALVR
jgi:NAD-dependent DNA ligase